MARDRHRVDPLLDEVLTRYGPRLEAELDLAVGRGGLRDLLRYHLGWQDADGLRQTGGGGKRLRPLLCLLTCEALGGDWVAALPAAAAIELVHNFSLIHDDIEDGSLQRRHRPTVWAVWGVPLALNAGDAMFVLARQALWRLRDNGIGEATVLRLAQLLDETCFELCQGQHLDLCFEARLDLATDDYLEMIRGKTAALLSGTLQFGAILASADEAAVAALAHCGRELGLAFQIRDDVLGIWGIEAATGKAVGADIASKKKTLPVVCALEQAEPLARARLRHIYGQKALSSDDVVEVMAILDANGARQFSEAAAEKHLEQAVQHLETVPLDDDVLATLKNLATYLVKREY